MKPAFSLCVYCGSRLGVNPAFTEIAKIVGTWIGQHQGQVVYGGGKAGLMGIVAEAALAAGARVVGIIPKALVEKEWAFYDCTELIVVDSMHERKRIMAERSDAFLALPGGIGTFEELFEVWTWRQLGYHDKPIGLLNASNYYEKLLDFLNSTVDAQFLGTSQMSLIRVGTQPVELLKHLVQDAGFSPVPRLDAI